MTPINHIAFLSVNDYPDAPWWVAAVEVQLREAAKAWGFPAPGVDLVSERAYVPPSDGALIVLADDDGQAESLGYHTVMSNQAWGIVGVREVAFPEVTISHEALELAGNPWLGDWRRDPMGYDWAAELCDPVEAQTYIIEATTLGQTKPVRVSNFILPAWFDTGTDLSVDRLGRLYHDHQIAGGGYAIVRRPDGTWDERYGNSAGMYQDRPAITGRRYSARRRHSRIYKGK